MVVAQEVTVESILTSRVDLVAIDVNMEQQEILEIIKNQNHSRIPVYEGSIDHIIGILQIRKYIKSYLRNENIALRDLLDEPFFIHQSSKIDDLLSLMSKNKMNVAIVMDNYGGTLGIVTVEDILEELVGEIWDEDDDAEENIIRMTEDTYSVNANDLVTDVLDELDIHYDEEEEDKITNKLMSELTYEHFASIPKEGDHFRYLNTEITVHLMKQNRIIRLKVKILEDEKEGEEE